MMGWYEQGWGWGTGLGMVMMLLVWGGLIALAVWAVARLTDNGRPRTVHESPRQILDRRFAAGEIDLGEYSAARQLLVEPSVATNRHLADRD